VALVGTQLGQTLTMGRFDPLVTAAALGSAAVLAVIVETPGVSQFFGCTPLGPVGWSIAAGSSTVATLAALAAPERITWLVERFDDSGRRMAAFVSQLAPDTEGAASPVPA
jgi:hypothetical protein